jgi:hypothetical protein
MRLPLSVFLTWRHEMPVPFPDFELADLEGRTWRATDLRGRPAVVFCFSTW